jgi:hypothetical protein
MEDQLMTEEDEIKMKKMVIILKNGKTIPAVDHSGRAVLGMNCLRSLERWDRGFESNGCLYCVRLFCVQVEALQRADPPSKESYQLCRGSRN